jgi:DNA repair exonuclease SbcCD nuclease subunit
MAGESLDLSDRVDLALLGHVHQPQSLTTYVHYVGSPFQQDYGEAGQGKRVGLLDVDTLELRWLSLPSRYPRYLRLNLPEFENYTSLGEDRATVTLRNSDEARRFHAHPLAQFVDPDYQFTGRAEVRRSASVPHSDPLVVMRTYVEERPLDGFETDEVLAIGREITGL